VMTLAQINASNKNLFTICINGLLVDGYFLSTRR
jgi:hypothetical protein